MFARICSAALAVLLAASLPTQHAAACTGIMLRARDGSIVHGRTVEFATPIDTTIAVVPRGYGFVGQTPKGDGLKYTSKYACVGIITFTDVKILDGVNEAGLSVGSFFFPGFADYAPVTAENQSKGISPADFPNWILTQFATVDEARQAIQSGAVVVTPTVIQNWGPQSPPFHYIVYDKTGACIVVEPTGGRLVIFDNPLGAFTNSPTFDWHVTNLRNYIALNPRNASPIEIDGLTLSQLGEGSGMLALPGDFTPPSRFIRAAVFSATAIASDTSVKAVEQVFHILNNFDIPVGAVRDESQGVMHTDYTMLTVARDPSNLHYYYKSYDDQTLRMFDLKQFDPDAKTIKMLSTKSQQPIVDMSDKAH